MGGHREVPMSYKCHTIGEVFWTLLWTIAVVVKLEEKTVVELEERTSLFLK
tara:strand:- start:126 stop:278 length:153 start_codon:yes stop_codon:yes gene_type:complete